VTLDELELELRRLRGVLAVGFVEAEGMLIVEVQVGPDTYDDVARDATTLAVQHAGGSATVEIVRWGDGDPHEPESRLRLLEVTTDPPRGELAVRLACAEEEAVGHASSAHGLAGVVEATVYAVRVFLPGLAFLPGWARTIETTSDRRFLVVASVTDPVAGIHRRGVADGSSPIDAAARATLDALNRTISRDLV